MKSTWPSICLVPWSPSCHLCPSISRGETEKRIHFIFLFKYMLLCVSTEALSGNLPQASENDIKVTFGHNFMDTELEMRSVFCRYHASPHMGNKYTSFLCRFVLSSPLSTGSVSLLQRLKDMLFFLSSYRFSWPGFADIWWVFFFLLSFTLVHLPSLIPLTPTHILYSFPQNSLILWSAIKRCIHTLTEASALRWHTLTSPLFIIN